MSKSYQGNGCLPVIAIFFIAFAIMFFAIWHSPAQSYEAVPFMPHPHHDWYAGKKDPVSKNGCCGNGDCAPIPLNVDWVQPTAGGFQVILTAEQAHDVNKNATLPINVIVPWSRVLPIAAGPPAALYHVCIVNNELRCLFIASGT